MLNGNGHQYHVFKTAAGYVAIGWKADSVTGLRLPASTEIEAVRALRRRLPGATPAVPSGKIADVVEGVISYFSGEHINFDHVAVDLGVQEPFFSDVYALVRKLGRGETKTYGAIARELGAGPEAARDVGQAMATNPVPLIVPCHRVMAAGGKVGGFSAPGGSGTKARMLELEGVAVAPADPSKKKAAAREQETQPGFEF